MVLYYGLNLVLAFHSIRSCRPVDDERALQIPELSVRRYFKEQLPSMWELQIPEDDVARESHRWPIGFVTTGFVHGRLGYIGYLEFNSFCIYEYEI